MSRGQIEMKVGQLAEATGVSVQAIRFYERRGLLPAPRRLQSGYRDYPAEAVRAVLRIKRMQEVGFTLRELEHFLRLLEAEPHNHIERRAYAQAKIRGLDGQIDRLLACNMSALDAEGRKRHKAVSEQMRAAVKELQPLPDGYAFRFDAEQATILLVSEFIARERLCCPFFRFELIAEQESGPLWLRLRGREGVKKFIEAELGLNQYREW